jgi:hypothetical protein
LKMKFVRIAAALLALPFLAACMPTMPLSEVRAALATGSLEVKVEETKNSVHVVTRGESFGSAVAQGNTGVAGALIGIAIMSSSQEAEIPISDGASNAIANILRKKFARTLPHADTIYTVALGDSLALVHPGGITDDYKLTYRVVMQIKDLVTNKLLVNNLCTGEDPTAMSLEKWRASTRVIESIKANAVSVCANQFSEILSP